MIKAQFVKLLDKFPDNVELYFYDKTSASYREISSIEEDITNDDGKVYSIDVNLRK